MLQFVTKEIQNHTENNLSSHHININHSIMNRFYDYSNFKTITETYKDIKHNLNVQSTDFEGKDLSVSLLPTIVCQDELQRISSQGRLIREALHRIISQYISEEENGHLHDFFKPYAKWKQLIKQEKRTLPHISLMRYDAIKNRFGNWAFLETNTACPGGVIHCSKIRNAWLMTKMGYKLTRGHSIKEYPIDSDDGFLLFLYQQASIIANNDKPNIAICSYKGTYKNEVDSLSNKFLEMIEHEKIPGGNLFTCDIREIKHKNGQTTFNGQKISLIYNKLDPLMINPADQRIEGWLKSSKSKSCDFLNSFASMYLTEAKRSLVLLSNKSWQNFLNFNEETVCALNKLIPKTALLDHMTIPRAIENRHDFILKADALTRGKGVYIGNMSSYSDWMMSVASTIQNKGVLQKYVDISERYNLEVDHKEPKLNTVLEYHGLDLFYFGDKFSGVVSRCHTNKIFNIGNGGKESPTLIIEEKRGNYNAT